MKRPEVDAARVKLVEQAVRLTVRRHRLPDASRDELREYRSVLVAAGVEELIVKEPGWDKRRGTKRTYLFTCIVNRLRKEALTYKKPGLRGDEIDEDRMASSMPTPAERVERMERAVDARAWRAELGATLVAIASEKPRYRLALAAFQEKAEGGTIGFIGRAAEQLGVDEGEVIKAIDALKKRLQRDETIARLRRTAPEAGLLVDLDDAEELDQQDTAAPEAAEDFDHDADAERADPAGARDGAGFPRRAGCADAAGGLACPEGGEGRDPAGEPAREGDGARDPASGRSLAPLSTWLTFNAPAVPRQAGCRRNHGRSTTPARAGHGAGRDLSARCPFGAGRREAGRREGDQAQLPSSSRGCCPPAHCPVRNASRPPDGPRGRREQGAAALIERWGPPARAAPPAPS